MRDKITTTYKKSQEQTEHNINCKAKDIAERLLQANRIDILDSKPAYITLEDPKENFRNRPTCRLINSCKSQIGLISEQILDKINRQILDATKINQWKNSSAVIEWFNNIETRNNSTFITFDVVNFYPSINRDLMGKAIKFAQRFVNITSKEIDIMSAKNTLLFNNNKMPSKRLMQTIFLMSPWDRTTGQRRVN